MPMRHAIDIDRTQRALARWVSSSVADEAIEVRWSGQAAPKVGRRWVVLNLVTPPYPRQIDHGDRLVVRPAVVRLVVAAVFAIGQRFRLVVNRYPYDVQALVANDPGAIATALAAAVAAGPEPVDAVAGATPGELTLAPAQPGDLQSVAMMPRALAATPPTVLATEDVFESGGSRNAVCSVTCYSPNGVGSLSADQIAADLLTHLAEKPTRNALNREGVGVWSMTPPRDVSGLQGTELERAVAFDLRLGLRARLARPGIPIESVEVLRTAAGITRTITIPTP